MRGGQRRERGREEESVKKNREGGEIGGVKKTGGEINWMSEEKSRKGGRKEEEGGRERLLGKESPNLFPVNKSQPQINPHYQNLQN